MKSLLLLFFITGQIYAQSIDHIYFEYDMAGNQIKRFTIDILPGKNSSTPKEVADLLADDLLASDIYDDIKYYPNPVKQDLFVQWTTGDNVFVAKIELFSMSGQQLQSIQSYPSTQNTVLNFSMYPEGLYNLVLLYNNGTQKTLKIVKR